MILFHRFREHSNGSSESEAGIYTCDEGREADDEQSDWFAEPDSVYGDPAANNQSRLRNFSNRLSWWNDNDLGLSNSAKVMLLWCFCVVAVGLFVP